MKRRWLIHGHFDPVLELSRKQKREIWRRARRLPGSPWRYVGLLALSLSMSLATTGAALWATIWAGLRGGLDAFGSWGWSLICVACLLSAIMLSAVVTWLYIRWAWRSQLLRALQSMGYEVCGRCGYRLHGLGEAETRCPECGEERSHCTCPHCGTTLPFRSARGMKCPQCGHGLGEAVPLSIPWIARWIGYLTVDRRLRKELPRSQRRALRRRVLAASRWWQRLLIAIFWAILLVPMVLVAYQAAYLVIGLHEDLWATNEWLTLIIITAWAASVFAACAGLGFAYGRPVRRLLREEGYEVCIRCGYWLRDLTDKEQRCPLCGAPREQMEGGE